MTNQTKPLATVLETEIRVKPSAAATPSVLFFGILFFTNGSLSFVHRLRRAIFAVFSYEMATSIHYLGHIISSKLAQAPMQGVQFEAPMPRAHYPTDQVTARAHMLRAAGGPLISLLAGPLMALLGRIFPAESVGREFCNIASIAHLALGGGSLMPLYFIDGGTLLKWALVEQGYSEAAADERVKQATYGLAVAFFVAGYFLAKRRYWKSAIFCFSQGISSVAIAMGKIRP